MLLGLHKHLGYRCGCPPSTGSGRPPRNLCWCSRPSASVDILERGEHSVRDSVLGETCALEKVVSLLAGVTLSTASNLINLGAVYIGEPIKGQGTIKWRRVASDANGAVLGVPEAGTLAALAPGTLVRVHPNPKRFPACHTTDWPRALIHADSDYVVINKPAGLPCMRHESNALEEVAGCASRALGLGPLEACHRLDQWTTGLLVLSRNKDANRAFKSLLEGKGAAAAEGDGAGVGRTLVAEAEASGGPAGARPVAGAVEAAGDGTEEACAFSSPSSTSSSSPPAPLSKVYRALTWAPVPLGRTSHYMYDGPFAKPPAQPGSGVGVGSGGSVRSQSGNGANERDAGGASEGRNGRASEGPGGGASSSTANGSGAGPVLSGGCLRARGPRLLSFHLHPGWKACVLEVLDCRVATPAAHAWLAVSGADRTCWVGEASGQRQQGSDSERDAGAAVNVAPAALYESSVLLITGRTHQIRAQFAAIGLPLVGDVMYGAIAGVLVDKSGRVTDEGLVRTIETLPQLEGPIGLHAAELTWEGRTLRAPAPWDRE